MKSNHSNNVYDSLIRCTGMVMLFVFINFTIVIPCLNFSGLDISVIEMVEEEEEEQEVYETDIHESMLHSMFIASTFKKDNHKEQIEPIHHPEVLTPPPKYLI